MLTWLTTVLSLAGTVLNVRKNATCFWLWLIANTLWLIYDIRIGLYSRAVLDVVQWGLAAWGIKEWRE